MPQEKTFTIKQADVMSGLELFVQQCNQKPQGKPIVVLNRSAAIALGRVMLTTIDLFKYTSLSQITKDLMESFRYGFFQPGGDEAEFSAKKNKTGLPEQVTLDCLYVGNRLYNFQFLLERLSDLNDQFHHFENAACNND